MRGGARWGCEDTACLWQLGRGNAWSWEQGGVAVVAGRTSAGVEGTLALVFPQGASGRGTGEGRGLQCKDPVFWRQGSDRTGGGGQRALAAQDSGLPAVGRGLSGLYLR